MAVVQVPPNCGGMTLTTSGAVTATANLITCTALEATLLTSPFATPGTDPIQSTNAAGGTFMIFAPVVTNITINSVGYAMTGGSPNVTTTPVPAADATAFIAGMKMVPGDFRLVSG